MRPQAWEWGQEPKALDTKLWLSFLSWQTPSSDRLGPAAGAQGVPEVRAAPPDRHEDVHVRITGTCEYAT